MCFFFFLLVIFAYVWYFSKSGIGRCHHDHPWLKQGGSLWEAFFENSQGLNKSRSLVISPKVPPSLCPSLFLKTNLDSPLVLQKFWLKKWCKHLVCQMFSKNLELNGIWTASWALHRRFASLTRCVGDFQGKSGNIFWPNSILEHFVNWNPAFNLEVLSKFGPVSEVVEENVVPTFVSQKLSWSMLEPCFSRTLAHSSISSSPWLVAKPGAGQLLSCSDHFRISQRSDRNQLFHPHENVSFGRWSSERYNPKQSTHGIFTNLDP